MKTLSEKEFNGFNVNAMFTERAERAKKELSPLMQEIRKYIPLSLIHISEPTRPY